MTNQARPELPISIQYQLDQFKKKFKDQIKSIDGAKHDFDKLSKYLMKLQRDDDYDKSMSGKLLPVYYIFNQEYQLAWILVHYLQTFWGPPLEFLLEKITRRIEVPDDWDVYVFEGDDSRARISGYLGTSCFRINNVDENEAGIKRLLSASEGKPPYFISPEFRHKLIDGFPNFQLVYHSFYLGARLLEVYFRQEKYAEAAECLFRLRFMVSGGEPPKSLIEFPAVRQTAAWVNTHDYWFQARLCTDAQRRMELAWTALYWCIETGLRTAGTIHRGLYMFEYFCQIAAEFRLFGDKHDEFWSHFKRFALHASISFCRKMIDYPVELIPFSERGLPGVAEFKRRYDEMYPPAK